MNRSPWVALVAAAIIGFSTVSLYAQRGPGGDDGPPPPPRNPDDARPRRDGQSGASGNVEETLRRLRARREASMREDNATGQGGSRTGGVEAQIRQLKEQVSRLSQQLERLQASAGRGGPGPQDGAAQDRGPQQRGPQARGPWAMRGGMGGPHGRPMMGRFGFRNRGDASQGRGQFRPAFGRFGGFQGRHHGFSHRGFARGGQGRGGEQFSHRHGFHSMGRSSHGFRGQSQGGYGRFQPSHRFGADSDFHRGGPEQGAQRGETEGQGFGRNPEVREMLGRLLDRFFGPQGPAAGRNQDDRGSEARPGDQNRGTDRPHGPRGGPQSEDRANAGGGQDGRRGWWQQGGARDGNGPGPRDGNRPAPRDGNRPPGPSDQRRHHQDDETSGDAGGDGRPQSRE